MKKILQRGFTLIELLVVIAIIGILAAVVLASLNDARDSGSDAAVKQMMSSVRNEAELNSNQNNFSYTGACGAANTLLTEAVARTGSTLAATNAAGAWNIGSCSNAAGAYAASVPLTASISGTVVHWCVDSTGASKQTTAALAANATVCPS